MTIVIVVGVAHCPGLGVKVYVVVAVLFTAGLQVPLMLLFDVVGNAASGVLIHTAGIWVNARTVGGFTTMVMVVVVAHMPAAGVNVYVVVAALFMAGVHTPLMPLLDVTGKAANGLPVQIGATCVNVGVTFGFTVIVIVVLLAH
ncbi:hypothetical protein D3C72_1647970 [compost metagenome]